MMNNVSLLKQYLQENELEPETWVNENDTCFQFRQKLKTGPSGRILIMLSDEDLVSVYALDYISLANSARKDYMCKLLNELNDNYTYYKFYLNKEDNIVLQCSIPVLDNFNSKLVIRIAFNAISIMENEYPNIMKAMWS